VEQAVEMIENSSLKEDKVLVIYLPDCHESIAGIIAGRIRERYYRPVFVLTSAEEGVKGSGRSIESYHMFEEMSRCRELFTRFGGHKLAAGLSLPEENVDVFRKQINELSGLTEEDLIEKVSIDMQLPLAYLSQKLVDELELLEPFGKGNPKPLFVEKGLRVISPRIVGKNQNVLKFQVEDARGLRMDAVYFGDVRACMEYMKQKNKMAFTYYPSVNEYMGRKRLQITVVHYR
jgi:single-stranded-DNA-specific exonuclease